MRLNQFARRSLDARLSDVDLSALTVPPSGWLRTIREALGMSTRQLAGRAGMSGAAVSKIERSEAVGTVQLDTLRKLADALDCEFVYALIPRRGLEEMVRQKAAEVAAADIAAVDRSMRLEDQAAHSGAIERQLATYTEELMDNGTLWRR